jgi:nucleoporin SEH1
MADNNQPGRLASSDALQDGLNALSSQLSSRSFLRHLTASRLPSAAVSDSSSLGPTRDEARSHARRPNINIAAAFEDEIEHVDLIAPLIQEPCADGSTGSVEQRVVDHLEASFVCAQHAYAKMAAERSFQTFSHGHQDLVLAVDFNYFGTRMATASSDHRIKVWDKKDDSWTLVESWKAHDAEIVDVSNLIFSRNLLPVTCISFCHLCEPSLTGY